MKLRVREATAVLVLDSESGGVIDDAFIGRLEAQLDAVLRCSDIDVLVVTAEGPRFVVGADVRMLRNLEGAAFSRFVNRVSRVFDHLEAMPIPTVAAMNGDAVGGGLELALACDIRIAAREARLGLPEVKLGLLPGAGGTQRLLQAVGKGRALELMYSGRLVSAAEALSIGLVQALSDSTEVLSDACTFAGELAKGSAPAQMAIKHCVLEGATGHRRGKDLEQSKISELFAGEEARRLIDGFLT